MNVGTACRARGLEEAKERVRRARFAKALEILDGPADDLEAFVALAESSELPEEEVVTEQR